MAPILFEETNVFKFPHSRMKKLMYCCTSKVDHTDFTSSNDLEQLLWRLERTFVEFIAHEEIENQFVMRKLKNRLREHASLNNNDLVCNCHKDDRFTPLMNLFRDGYAFIRRGNADRISYRIELHKAISQFYQDFLPHMLEEENDIQPLLFKYFTDIELKIMRIEVIRMTLKRRENSSKNPDYSIERPLLIYSTTAEMNNLPNEILLRIFKYYLNPFDLLQNCMRVNKKWRSLIKDRILWKSINPINWSKNRWNSNFPYDENHLDDDEIIPFKIKEMKFIDGFKNCFLPIYGFSIETLILYGSLTINDNQARKIFSLCPNLKHLNVGKTLLSSKAFFQYRWLNSLETLIFEGCELIDDHLFFNLISSKSLIVDSIEDAYRYQCEKMSFSKLNIDQQCAQCSYKCFRQRTSQCRLKHLNLSGCYRITDQGLKYLIDENYTKELISIDLSGCIQISSSIILLLIESSKKLQLESTYFCDYLRSSSTKFSAANGCRNIENQSGLCCCRSIS